MNEGRNGFDFIQFEDLLPPLEEASTRQLEDPPESPINTRKRYYIAPTVSDDALLRGDLMDIGDWPKSRVIWALGRLGYLNGRVNITTAPNLPRLHIRMAELLDTCNTRDLVRTMQGIAYGPAEMADFGLVNRIRKNFSVKIESVNELFLVSFVYANIKLMARSGGRDNCHKALQFLLSEMVHRKHKIYCNNWLEICSALLAVPAIRDRHKDSIEMILQHACTFSLKHVKDVKVVAGFARQLGQPGMAHGIDIRGMNDILISKFTREWRDSNDAINFGFYFFMNNLLTPNVVDRWINAIRTAKQGRLDLTQFDVSIKMEMIADKLADGEIFISSSNSDWIQEMEKGVVRDAISLSDAYNCISGESVHVSKVLRRMMTSVFGESSWSGKFFGPYWCSLVVDGGHVIEWEDGYLLEPPHRQAWVRLITESRRRFLEKSDVELILLKRADFAGRSVDDMIECNKRLAYMLSKRIPNLIPRDGPFCLNEERVKLIPERVEEPTTRIHRESKRIENSLKAKRRTITRQYRKKISR